MNMQNVLSLNDYGVAEMQQHELVETDGGSIPLIALGVAVTALTLTALNTNWDAVSRDLERGAADGANAYN